MDKPVEACSVFVFYRAPHLKKAAAGTQLGHNRTGLCIYPLEKAREAVLVRVMSRGSDHEQSLYLLLTTCEYLDPHPRHTPRELRH